VPVAVNFTSEPAQLGLVPVVCVKLTELMLTLGVTLSATLLLLATGVLLLMHARLLLTEQLTGPATGLDMAKSRPCMVSTVPPHTALNSLAGRLLKGLPSLNMPSSRKATSVALLHVGLVPLTWLTTTLLGTMLSAGLTLNAKSGGEATLPLLLTQLRELLTLLACTLTLLLAWKPKPWPVMVSAPALHVALRSALALVPSLYVPCTVNSTGEPEQVEALPCVWLMLRLSGSMLTVERTTRATLLLLATGVLLLMHARLLVTEHVTEELEGEATLKERPCTVIAPGDHTALTSLGGRWAKVEPSL
jgi:hypothetical protein